MAEDYPAEKPETSKVSEHVIPRVFFQRGPAKKHDS